MNARRILAVTHKEWREMVRDPLSLVMGFVVPFALMLLIGFGMTFDIENIPLAIVDRDGGAASRDYAYRFIGSRYFDFKGYIADERRVAPLLMDGKLRAVIVIPEKFERDLLAARPVSVQVLLDGAFPDRVRVTKGYISAINGAATRELIAGHLSRRDGIPVQQATELLQPFSLELRYLYNQGVRSDWSIPPKLIMFILFFIPAFMTSLRVVREKEIGTIFNVYTSPLTRVEFLVAKLAPYVAIALINLFVLWLLAVLVFQAPFKGSFLLFFGAGALFVIATTCIGMLVSVFVRTQIAAMLISLVIAFVPALQYSELEIPVASMGPDAQAIAHMLPGMHYVRVITGTFLKNVGLEVLWPEVLVLAAQAGGLFFACYLLFHKRVRA